MAIRYVTPGYSTLVMDLGREAAARKTARQAQGEKAALQRQREAQSFQAEMAEFEQDMAVQAFQMNKAWELEKMRRHSELDFEYDEKKRVTAKEELDARLKAIYQSMDDGIISKDVADNQVRKTKLKAAIELDALGLHTVSRELLNELTYRPRSPEEVMAQRMMAQLGGQPQAAAQPQQAAPAPTQAVPVSKGLSLEELQQQPGADLATKGGKVLMIDSESGQTAYVDSARVMDELKAGNRVVPQTAIEQPFRELMQKAAAFNIGLAKKAQQADLGPAIEKVKSVVTTDKLRSAAKGGTLFKSVGEKAKARFEDIKSYWIWRLRNEVPEDIAAPALLRAKGAKSEAELMAIVRRAKNTMYEEKSEWWERGDYLRRVR